MSLNIFQVLATGLGAALQDQGRFGWRRFGVPSSGAMDDHAADWANRLLDNPAKAPVMELLWQGAKLAALNDVWISITGADAESNVSMWRVVRVRAGEVIQFPRLRSGLWIYMAVEGGFDAPCLLGSASVFPRGQLGQALAPGHILGRKPDQHFQLPPGVAGRVVAAKEQRNYEAPPALRVWPGPQWDHFVEADRALFFNQDWAVSSRSDRVGYRLTGEPLKAVSTQIISEPVRVGSVQIPENGQPIVTMRDGPTVGGYLKLGLIHPADLSWLAQCRPGQKVRFQAINEA